MPTSAEVVRRFYERHPYPGYVEGLDAYRQAPPDRDGKLAHHLLRQPRQPYREDHAILIAGCGTVQAVKHAMRWPQAQVTGIDISEASLEQARAFKADYQLDNLELHALPVEQAPSLGRTFDEIVCTGVIHHLPDPGAGLAALRAVLAPGGAMQLMLYAPYGRAGIYLLQAYCRLAGVDSSSADIRDLTAMLHLLPEHHPLWPLLQGSPDFRYDAGVADALLHPQDRPYSVPQMLAFIEDAGLRFGRWQHQAPYLPHCGAVAGSPHFTRLAALDASGQYAAMELFRGDMVRHTAIVYRDDTPAEQTGIDFSAGKLAGCRPLLMAGATCVEERLPAGTAAILLNRRHSARDIYMPVDASQRDAWKGIDGNTTVGELLDSRQPTGGAAFFEALWRHDQIVFDAAG